MDDFSAFPAVSASPAVPAAAGGDFSAFPAVGGAPVAGAATPAANPQASGIPGVGGVLDSAKAFQSGAMQGMTLGFDDEINAGLMTPIQMAVDAVQGKGFDPGASYNRALDGGRAIDAQSAALSPVADTAGQIVGSLATGGTLAKGGLTLMNGAAPTIASILPRAAAEGAVYGGVQGFGSGSDLGDRLHQAMFGALAGGGIGGALGTAAGALGARAANKTGLSSDAVTLVRNALMGDQEAAANIAAAGPGAMVADAGPNSAQLLDLAMQRAGPGANSARNAVDARAADANDLVQQALASHLGQPAGLATISSELRTATQPAVSAAYDTAYAAPFDLSAEPELAGVLARVPKSIKANAIGMMRMEGKDSANPLMAIDYMKRALQDAADSAEGQGAMGGLTNKGRIYQNLAAELRDSAAAAVPAYGDALALASDPITARSAAKFGTTMLSPSVPMDVVKERISTMTPADVESLKQGVAGNIAETVANVRAVASDPNLDARQAQQALAMLSTDAAKAKLGAIPGLDVAHLTGQLDEASKALQLRANTATNSKTFSRLSADEALNDAMNTGPINALRRGKPIDATQAIVQAIMRSSPKAQSAYKGKVFGEVADALTKSRGPDAGAFAGGIVNSGGALPKATQAVVDAIIAAGADQGRRAAHQYLMPAAL